MPTRDVAPVGAPCWIDLLTSDPDASRAFYSELFGWTAEAPNAEFGGYWQFTKNGVPVAGGMGNDGSSGTPDGWNVHLATDDVKATLDKAVENGGQVIVPAMDVGDLGTMSMVTDAGGAAIGAWQPNTFNGFGVLGEPGAPSWFELHTRDYDATVAFYRTVFGWNAQTMSDTPEFKYTTLGAPGEALAGIMDAGASLPAGVPAHWSVYFGVADTDAALVRIGQLGGAMVTPAEDTPYGRLATASDPTGAVFKLMG